MFKKVLAAITAAVMFMGICGVCTAEAVHKPPVVFAVSESAEPGETVMIYGDNFEYGCTAELKNTETQNGVRLTPEYLSKGCMAVTVPPSEAFGVYEICVFGNGLRSESKYVNLPKIDYIIGDEGETVSGGFTVIGRNLCMGAVPIVVTEKDGRSAAVTLAEYGKYCVKANISGAEEGEYTVKIKNDENGIFSAPININIVQPSATSKTSVSLANYGADATGSNDSTAAFRNAIAAAKGGIINVPRGRYKISDTLEIPDNTEIIGAAADLTSITWVPGTGSKPDILKGGNGLSVKNLTVYVCGEYGNVISGKDNVAVENVMIRAAAYYHHAKIGSIGGTYSGAAVSEKPYNMGSAVYVNGGNFKMSGCDIYATNTCFTLKNAEYAQIKDNKFRFGVRPFETDGCGKIIIEGNEFEGTSTYEQEAKIEGTDNIYIADNTIEAVYGGKRTAISVNSVLRMQAQNVTAEGRKIIFPTSAETQDLYAALENGKNIGVYITDGTGAGQRRKIISQDGTSITVDSEWDVVPDETSVLYFASANENITVVGNTFTDAGTALKLEAAASSVFAKNTLVRTAPIAAEGIYYYGTISDNEVEAGFIWGGKSGSVNMNTERAYGCEIRRNTMQSNCFVGISGENVQTLVEGNTVNKSENGFVADGLKNAVLKNNMFEDVRNVHSGATAAETSASYPYDGQGYVSPSECEITLYFDLPMSTDTFGNIAVSDLNGNAEQYEITEKSAQMCRIALSGTLNKNTVYKINIGNGVKDVFGNSFKEETISFVTSSKALKCMNLSITDESGNQLEKISRGQTANISFDIKNCSEIKTRTAAFLAVYDENGRLINAYTSAAEVNGGETAEVNIKWCAVPEECDSVRLMIWSDYMPIAERAVFSMSD